MAEDQTGADEQVTDAQATEGETSTEDTSNDGAAEADSEGSDDAGQEGTQSADADEPPVRKSAKDFIIERKDRKIAKLQGEDGTDAAQPDIRTVIQEELAPIKATFAKSADEQELQAAFTKFPEAKKMEKTIRTYMDNDAYARVPVEFIVRGLIGAREVAKQKADTEAKGTRQGGHTRRPTETKTKSAWELSDAEFNNAVTKLMSGNTQ
jgi:hypothetical protein